MLLPRWPTNSRGGSTTPTPWAVKQEPLHTKKPKPKWAQQPRPRVHGKYHPTQSDQITVPSLSPHYVDICFPHVPPTPTPPTPPPPLPTPTPPLTPRAHIPMSPHGQRIRFDRERVASTRCLPSSRRGPEPSERDPPTVRSEIDGGCCHVGPTCQWQRGRVNPIAAVHIGVAAAATSPPAGNHRDDIFLARFFLLLRAYDLDFSSPFFLFPATRGIAGGFAASLAVDSARAGAFLSDVRRKRGIESNPIQSNPEWG